MGLKRKVEFHIHPDRKGDNFEIADGVKFVNIYPLSRMYEDKTAVGNQHTDELDPITGQFLSPDGNVQLTGHQKTQINALLGSLTRADVKGPPGCGYDPVPKPLKEFTSDMVGDSKPSAEQIKAANLKKEQERLESAKQGRDIAVTNKWFDPSKDEKFMVVNIKKEDAYEKLSDEQKVQLAAFATYKKDDQKDLDNYVATAHYTDYSRSYPASKPYYGNYYNSIGHGYDQENAMNGSSNEGFSSVTFFVLMLLVMFMACLTIVFIWCCLGAVAGYVFYSKIMEEKDSIV